jgi:predicted nuclease of restriction endonuclease-like (RecB) superfamily
MPKPIQRKKVTIINIHGYDNFLARMVALIEGARQFSVRTVNAIMTATYWEIGRRIVENEQSGRRRAGYGETLIIRLSNDLASRFGRGFAKSNLYQMRAFFLTYRDIFQTLSGKSRSRKLPTVSGTSDEAMLQSIAKHFPLSWSSYVRLLSLKSEQARRFYEIEAIRNGWSIRQLDRQINSQFYERTALSKNKVKMLTKERKIVSTDVVRPEEEIKDPYILEFLALKDEYSEHDLEEALIGHLENFLLELGGDFAFIGRQRRLRVDDEWYRIDLIFFHRRLRCLVVIDLKIGKLTHADAGQMHMYLNYAREHWTRPGENPPVGLILCAQKGSALAKYALEGLSNKVMAAEYRTVLPDEKVIAEELEKTRNLLEGRRKHAGRFWERVEDRRDD